MPRGPASEHAERALARDWPRNQVRFIAARRGTACALNRLELKPSVKRVSRFCAAFLHGIE